MNRTLIHTISGIIIGSVSLGIVAQSLFAENEPEGYPPSENFSNNAGISLDIGMDTPDYVAAYYLNNDDATDLLLTDSSGDIFTFANKTQDASVKFEKMGSEFKVDGKVITSEGEDLDNDGDIDVILGLQGQRMPIFSEEMGTITSITDTKIVDTGANWSLDELKGMKIRLNLQNEGGICGDINEEDKDEDEDGESDSPCVFKITANGGINTKPEEHPLGIDAKTLYVEGGGLLAAFPDPTTAVGQYYSYKRGATKLSSPPRAEIYFNDGNGALAITQCTDSLRIPANQIIDGIIVSDVIGADGNQGEDENKDIILKHSKYTEGRISNAKVYIGYSEWDIADLLKSELADDQLAEFEGMSMKVKIEDKSANYAPNRFVGQNINPNINQSNFFHVMQNTDKWITFNLDVSSSMGTITAVLKLTTLLKSGNIYRIRSWDPNYSIYTNYGNGCFWLNEAFGENGIMEEDEFEATFSGLNLKDPIRIPDIYTTLGADVGEIGPPYKGALLDINSDNATDILFIANGVFYKLNGL